MNAAFIQAEMLRVVAPIIARLEHLNNGGNMNTKITVRRRSDGHGQHELGHREDPYIEVHLGWT